MSFEILNKPLLKITVYSHFIKVTDFDQRISGLILKFCTRYIHRGIGPTRDKPGAFKVYATCTAPKSEYRFHIFQFQELLDYLRGMYIDNIEIIRKELYHPNGIFSKVKEGWVLREDQEQAREFIVSPSKGDVNSKLLTLKPGAGKEQPLYSMIKVPGGWKRMGEMKVGQKVVASDGTITKVTGVYPQGIKTIYRVTFSDGRSADCGLEHLWQVYDRQGSGEWKVLSTRELLRFDFNSPNTRWAVPLITPEEGADFEFLIQPYSMGVLIGDGSIRHHVGVSLPDEEIKSRFEAELPKDLSLTRVNEIDYNVSRGHSMLKINPYLVELRRLGLFGLYSYEKTIPERYLHASYSQRLALIQGLMDTDGTAGRHGTISYSTTSKALAFQIQYLVRSIGGLAKISEKSPTFTYNGITKNGRKAYQVNIRHNKPSSFFSLSRKKERTNDFNQYAKTLRLRIEKIEEIGEYPAQCISVEHSDHLYVTDDFVVTHNTVTSVVSAVSTGSRTAIVVLPKYLDKWTSDIPSITDAKKQDIMLVQGSSRLKGLIQMAKDGDFHHDFVVIALTTLKDFYKLYEEDPFGAEFESYGILPEELFELLGIGTIIIDEGHEHLHAIFKMIMYMHVPLLTVLTGTMMSDDSFISKIQHKMFPSELRFEDPVIDKYTKVYALSYDISDDNFKFIKTTQPGSSNYSHTAFEKSILKNRVLLEKYMKVVAESIQFLYVRDLMPGDKLGVYASSIKMCTHLTEYLKKAFPSMDVRRYVEDDPYVDVIEPDIRVTTIQSGGTAIDIPGLRAVVLTTSISSSTSNIQVFGRLRKLKDRDVKFGYIYSPRIKKQRHYHERRKQLLRDRAASIKDLNMSVGLW